MAVIQYTGAVNQIRGKLNGSVFNKSKNAFTLQRKQAPKQGSSLAQTKRRREFGQVQRAYKQLNQTEKDLATQAGLNNPVFDRLGDLTQLSGYNQWVKANVIRVQADLPIINALDPTPAPTFAFDVTFNRFVFNFYSNGVINGESQQDWFITQGLSIPLLVVFSVSAPRSRGISSPATSWHRLWSVRTTGGFPTGSTQTVKVGEDLVSTYPVPAPDEVVMVRAQIWRDSSGSLIFESVLQTEPVVIVH